MTTPIVSQLTLATDLSRPIVFLPLLHIPVLHILAVQFLEL